MEILWAMYAKSYAGIRWKTVKASSLQRVANTSYYFLENKGLGAWNEPLIVRKKTIFLLPLTILYYTRHYFTIIMYGIFFIDIASSARATTYLLIAIMKDITIPPTCQILKGPII